MSYWTLMIGAACVLSASVAVSGADLVVNGGAESGDLSGWTLDASEAPAGEAIFAAVMEQPSTGFEPSAGDWFFVFDLVSTEAPLDSGIVVGMVQEGDIPDGSTGLDVQTAVGSAGSGSCDPGRVVLTWLDANGDPLGVGYDSDWVLSFVWTEIGGTAPIVPGAARYRLELQGRLDCGTFINTYFDAVSVVPVGCFADFDGSGDVGTPDLLQLLASWGPCDGCTEDLDCGGAVDTPDLLALLASWGACP